MHRNERSMFFFASFLFLFTNRIWHDNQCFISIRYNDVLKNGLPNWKSAVYYYRHVRKMGLTEMAIILFVIITVCQYIISWAAYAEKKFTAVSSFILYRDGKCFINQRECLTGIFVGNEIAKVE